MTRLFSHKPFLVTIALAIIFIVPILAGVSNEVMLEVWGALLFVALCIGLKSYLFRAVQLYVAGAPRREDVQIIGFALLMLAIAVQRVSNAVYRYLERPDWFNESPIFSLLVFLVLVGFGCLALSSLRPSELAKPSKVGGFFVGFITATGVALSGVGPLLGTKLGAVWRFLMAIFS